MPINLIVVDGIWFAARNPTGCLSMRTSNFNKPHGDFDDGGDWALSMVMFGRLSMSSLPACCLILATVLAFAIGDLPWD